MDTNNGLPLIAPRVPPVLDPAFRPAVLATRAFHALVSATPDAVPVGLALEQADGSVFRFDLRVLPESHPQAAANGPYLERFVKFILWSRGGWRISIDAPAPLAAHLSSHYRDTATGRFDAELVALRMFDHPLEVVHTRDLPAERSRPGRSGGTSRGIASASISAAATARSPRSSTAASSSAKKPCGTRITSRIRSTTSTASWTRSPGPPRTCPASTRSAAAPPEST